GRSQMGDPGKLRAEYPGGIAPRHGRARNYNWATRKSQALTLAAGEQKADGMALGSAHLLPPTCPVSCAHSHAISRHNEGCSFSCRTGSGTTNWGTRKSQAQALAAGEREGHGMGASRPNYPLPKLFHVKHSILGSAMD